MPAPDEGPESDESELAECPAVSAEESAESVRLPDAPAGGATTAVDRPTCAPFRLDDRTIRAGNPTLEDGLRALRDATEQGKAMRIELDDDYLALIAAVEACPDDRSGTDKSWV